jgi:transposase
VQAESLSLRNKLQGALPLVDHFLQGLSLRSLLEEQIAPAHYVAALELLVKSVLIQPNALYRIEAWAQPYDPALRPTQHLGDDALGRALDRLFEADRASLLTTLVVQAVRAFDVQTAQIHNDSTSIKFSGAYARQKPNAVQLRRGFSKDHRPDLKQLIYSLSVSADGAVPVHFKAYAGNQTDDGTHWETWQCLCRLLGRSDFLYVADCKLCVSQTLLRLDQEQGRFITILPRNRSEVGAFAQQAADCQVRWEPLWTRRAGRRHQRREVFESAAGLYQMQEGFRIHWFRSSEKRLYDAQDRQDRIAVARQRLEGLNERRGRGPKTEPAVRRAAENLLIRYRVGDWVEYHIALQQKAQFVQTTRGKPSAQTAYRRVVKTIPVVSTTQNAAAIARSQTTDGTFPLVTNTDLSALEVLKKYKYQPHLEKRHFLNKSVLEISPVFLKKNTRIEALMFIFFIAELVAALIERAIRQNMTRRHIKAIPILPEGRYSKTPSYAQILDTFAARAKCELYQDNQLVKVFVQPLTEIEQAVLDLLDVDAAVYR